MAPVSLVLLSLHIPPWTFDTQGRFIGNICRFWQPSNRISHANGPDQKRTRDQTSLERETDILEEIELVIAQVRPEWVEERTDHSEENFLENKKENANASMP